MLIDAFDMYTQYYSNTTSHISIYRNNNVEVKWLPLTIAL